MANKRMFSKQITESDAFLDMPVSSKLLYFHLNMGADDDGFVANPKKILRMVGSSQDDLKILLTKRFLLSFESGVVVIKHWLLHNAVRKDMYCETQYLDDKKMLQIKDNKVYTEVCNETVTSPSHRLDQDRLDQDRLDQDRLDTVSDETELSYEEPPKETFDTKAKTFEKLGIPYEPPKKSSKQEQYFERSKLVGYFKEAVNQEHAKSYFTHPEDIKDISKENSKISKQLKDFYERCENLEKAKEVIDWFASGYGVWCEYKPSGCFRKETVIDFENKTTNKSNCKKIC